MSGKMLSLAKRVGDGPLRQADSSGEGLSSPLSARCIERVT
jgi:hypothetical protein